VWSIIRRLLETIQACLLDLADLITDQPTTIHVATQLSHRVGRYWLVLGRAQIFKSPGGLLQLGIASTVAYYQAQNAGPLRVEAGWSAFWGGC
jgi:hypothetical protein